MHSMASKTGVQELAGAGSGITTSQGPSVMANLKSIKLTAEEQAFTMEYRSLEDLEREKGIKFFQCVGDPPHTDVFVNNLDNRR